MGAGNLLLWWLLVYVTYPTSYYPAYEAWREAPRVFGPFESVETCRQAGHRLAPTDWRFLTTAQRKPGRHELSDGRALVVPREGSILVEPALPCPCFVPLMPCIQASS